MKKLAFACAVFLYSLSALCQSTTPESKEARDQRMGWWRDATFGMFIHWGPYAVPAGVYQGKEIEGIGEWIMHSAKIPIPEYEEFAKAFNPQQYNAREWVRIAKEAGVKYIVITSKHHDGFGLWDSKVSSYDIMDFTSFKRDILKELADACKEAGIKLCFYHSIMDWHQPDARSKDYPYQPNPQPDFAKYREEYLKPQLTELINNYDPEVLWFDGEWIPEWTEAQGKDLYNYLRALKPSLIINNRIGKGRSGMQGMNKYKDAAGDFGTPEQEILEGTSNFDWESCMTMNDTWGFKKNDQNWKSAETLIHNLVDIAAKGGNYLLNVGPTAEGLIPQPSVERLTEMGDWLRINGEAIYATNSLKQFKEGDDIRFTTDKSGRYVYAIVTNKIGKTVNLQSIKARKGSKIRLLGYDQPLQWKTGKDGLHIELPAELPGKYAWVLKIEGSQKPE